MTRLAVMTLALLAIPSAAAAEGDAETDGESTEPEAPPDEGSASGGDDEPVPNRPRADEPAEEERLEKVGKARARMTLPGGKFVLTAVVEANMAEGGVGKPMSVAPDLWIGAADRLSLGVVHSGRAATGFLTGFGTGLCFRGGGAMGACATGLGDVYTFAGGEARIGLTEGGFALAFVAGVHARQFEPDLVLSGKAGLLARLSSNRIALELAPTAYLGITQRTIDVGGMDVDYNVDQLGAPVTVYLRLAGSFALAIQGGVTFVLKDVGNTWQVPAAVGLSWWVTPHVSIDAAFGLAAVADSDDATEPFDRRSATMGIGYAL